MRVFAALELSTDVRTDLSAVAAAVRRLSPAWAQEKWVAPENLHLTLAFAGELDEDSARRLVDLLGPALAPLRPCEVALAALAAVPAPRRAAMLWVVPGRDTPEVAAIADAIRTCVTAVGGENDERPFRAHLTLVRTRRPRRISRDLLAQAWGSLPRDPTGKPVERIVSGAEVTVFSSTLTPRGPIYVTLARIPVGDA